MNRLTLTSRIGPDGILQLNVPVGPGEANHEVRVTIEPNSASTMTQDEWRQWVERLAGSITDPAFRRHDQGDYDLREALP